MPTPNGSAGVTIEIAGLRGFIFVHVGFRMISIDYEFLLTLSAKIGLVYRLLNPLSFVAFKMGRLRGGPSRTGGRKEHPAPV